MQTVGTSDRNGARKVPFSEEYEIHSNDETMLNDYEEPLYYSGRYSCF